MKKGRVFGGIIAGFLFSAAVMFGFVLTRPVEVRAETNTDGYWTSGQTNNLIPVLNSDSNISGLGFTFSHNHSYTVYQTDGHGYGIRPNNTYDDIGDGSDYSGGMYYTIQLSDADRVKADLNQLTLSASSWYYIASVSQTTYLSLNVSFYNSGNSLIQAEISETYKRTQTSSGTKQLTLENISVPSGTSRIQMRWSAVTNGAQRPWVADMQCYLYDTTSPSYAGLSVDASAVTDATAPIAVSGDSLTYYVEFDEKVSLVSSGTATLSVEGRTLASSTNGTLVTEAGKSKVGYAFTLSEGTSSGTLVFSVSGLSVIDEAQNPLTYSATPSAKTAVQYYKTMNVEGSLSNLTMTGNPTAVYGTDYSAVLTAAEGYSLPSAISVKVDRTELSTSQYTYRSDNGAIVIKGTAIKGDIVITAAGTANSYTVTLDMQGGSGGTPSVVATYDSTMPSIVKPARTGYTFSGYFTLSDGNGTAYYDSDLTALKPYDFASDTTLYAFWTANTYTVIYDSNKPVSASGMVEGTMQSTLHTYDSGSTLRENGYRLDGWTFQGWSTEKNGRVEYADGAEVFTLSENEGSSVTLYAVWKANTYTVTYDSNKPSSASGTIEGDMQSSLHTYDTGSLLKEKEYLLDGWTFQGWSTKKEGQAEYPDKAEVRTLSKEEGSSVTLFAVWKANTYTVTYDSNKPSSASGTIEGTMQNTTHTYDSGSTLRENGYRLDGWTFQGWSTEKNGQVEYADGEEIFTLSKEEGASVTLYAVWKANTYTVTYDSNKPSSASGTIEGDMQSSLHTYDTGSLLKEKEYLLDGWTFQGWSTKKEGQAEYPDKAEVRTLSKEEGSSVTLYAVWKANTYTVTLNSMGGTAYGSVYAVFDSSMPAITLPNKQGYLFQGYYSEKDGQGLPYYDAEGNSLTTYAVSGDIMLYAWWEPVTYTIQFYNGSEYVYEMSDVTFGNLYLPSSETIGMTRQNYNFVGWNLYAEQNWSMYSAETLYSVGLVYENDGIVVLYAAWSEKDQYAIIYDANGGTGAPAMSQAHVDETIKLDETIPVRKNYTCLGWSVSSSGDQPDYLPGESFTMGNNIVTFYAIWIHDPGLSYDANGGDFLHAANAVYVPSGSSVPLTGIEPSREGYRFLGWALSADAGQAEYQGGSEFVMPDTDTILYAVWAKASYSVSVTLAEGYQSEGLADTYFYEENVSFTVTGNQPKVYVNAHLLTAEDGVYSFVIREDTHVIVKDASQLAVLYVAEGGTNVPVDARNYTSGETIVILSDLPERVGYRFLGWALSSDAGQAEYQGGDTYRIEQDTTFYAVWEADTYTVIYDANGGINEMENSVFTWDQIGLLSENLFEKEGYTFAGWSFYPDGGVDFIDGDEIVNLCAEKSLILYAVWEQTITEIRFDANGGSGGTTGTSVIFGEYLSSNALSAPGRNGYLFDGYYTEIDGGEKIFDAEMNVSGFYAVNAWNQNTETLILYAHWEPIAYTVVYFSGTKTLSVQEVFYDQAFDLTTSSALGLESEEGYHFAGWATLPGSSVISYSDGQTIATGLTYENGSAVHLYAVFAEDEKASVIYDANGGTNAPVDGNTYPVGKEVAISPVIPEKEGYVFLGWSYDPNGSDIEFRYENGEFVVSTLTMSEGGVRLYAVWEPGLTLQKQIDELTENLNARIDEVKESLAKGDSALEEKIAELSLSLKNAEDLLNSLGETYATKTELQGAVSTAKDELNAAIENVKNELESAVNELNASITENKEDIEAKLSAVEEAYKAADILLRSDINGISERVTDLEIAYQTADAALNVAIENVKNELESAVNELNASISGNKEDIETKLSAVEEAYKAADALVNSNLNRISDRVTDLEEAYRSADAVLNTAIENVKSELESAVNELNASIAGNKEDIEVKMAAVEEAYQAADILLTGNFNGIRDRVMELETAYQTADAVLNTAIENVKNELESAVNELNASITGNKEDIEAKLAAVEEAYKAADALVNSNLNRISDRVTDLEEAYRSADAVLNTAIENVKSELESAVNELNASIAGNKEDIEVKMAAVEEAYQAADILLTGNFNGIRDRVMELETAYQTADAVLNTAIENVKNELESAVNELNASITGNKEDIEAKLAAVEEAYKAADILLTSNLSGIRDRVMELETAYQTADAALAAKDAMLEQRIDDLIAENDRVERIYTIINASLGALSAGLTVLLVVRFVKERKARKKKAESDHE